MADFFFTPLTLVAAILGMVWVYSRYESIKTFWESRSFEAGKEYDKDFNINYERANLIKQEND